MALPAKYFERRAYKKRAKIYFKDHTLTAEEIAEQKTQFTDSQTLISLVVPLFNTNEDHLREMLESVLAQTYFNWELCLADGSDGDHMYVGEIVNNYKKHDGRIKYNRINSNKGIAQNTNIAAKMAEGSYIGLLDHDDVLAPNALYECMLAIQKGADFIYTDEVNVVNSVDNPRVIHFKPEFAPYNLMANNYICHFSLFKRELFEQVGGISTGFDGSQDHHLILKLTDIAENIVHIPKVLYYWRIHKNSVAGCIDVKPYCLESGKRAVTDFLNDIDLEGDVSEAVDGTTFYRLNYTIPEDIKVSYGRRANNFTVRNAENEYVLICEKYIEKPDEEIVNELLMFAVQDNVGLVGGMLTTGRKIISGAVRLCEDIGFEQVYENIPIKRDGYMKKLRYAQNVTAVSNTVVMIKKEIFEQAGGFDERLKPDERMVDLCLRIGQLGYDVVFNPYALCKIKDEVKLPRKASSLFKEKWKEQIDKGDPYYSDVLMWYMFGNQ